MIRPAVAAFILISLATAAPALAQAPNSAPLETESIRFGNAHEEIAHDRARHLTVSSRCLAAKPAAPCSAMRAFEQVRLPSGPAPAAGAKGARAPGKLCGIAGGRVVIGARDQGGENSFCAFPDGSLLDLGSLWYAAGAKR